MTLTTDSWLVSTDSSLTLEGWPCDLLTHITLLAHVIVVYKECFPVLAHVSRGEYKTVVRKVFHREVIEADWLLSVTTTIDMVYEDLFGLVVVVEVGRY